MATWLLPSYISLAGCDAQSPLLLKALWACGLLGGNKRAFGKSNEDRALLASVPI